MAQLEARKANIEKQLADPAVYAGDQKESVQQLVFDQDYLVKELGQLEAEWLEQQTQLEQLAA